jgi:hypothetical protein
MVGSAVIVDQSRKHLQLQIAHDLSERFLICMCLAPPNSSIDTGFVQSSV